MTVPVNPNLAFNVQANMQNLDKLKNASNPNGAAQQSFAEVLSATVEDVVTQGHEVEVMSLRNQNTTDLALAMDQFLTELSTLKALVDETRKSIEKLFQEGKA